jgi:hypothetical protein
MDNQAYFILHMNPRKALVPFAKIATKAEWKGFEGFGQGARVFIQNDTCAQQNSSGEDVVGSFLPSLTKSISWSAEEICWSEKQFLPSVASMMSRNALVLMRSGLTNG